MCNNDPNAAARSIIKVLNANTYTLVKNIFECEYTTAEKKIVSGMKLFIADHSNLPGGGTRQSAVQNAIDAVLLAAVWNLEKSERIGRDLSRTIGVRKDAILNITITPLK